MGFSFRKRIKLAPGITVNLSRSGVSTTIGPKGAKLTVGGKRGPRATVGVPGTGVSYSSALGKASRRDSATEQPAKPGPSRVFVLLVLACAALAAFMGASVLLGR